MKQFESYEKLVEFNRRKNAKIRECRANIGKLIDERENLESELAIAVLGGESTTAIEKSLEKVDREFERNERILENLDNPMVFVEQEEELTRLTLEEFGREMEESGERMRQKLAEIEEENEKIWSKIDEYLEIREGTLDVIKKRKEILDDAVGKEFFPRVKDVGNPGRMPELNPTNIPLITHADVAKRFGRRAR